MVDFEPIAAVFAPLLGDGIRTDQAEWLPQQARAALENIAHPELEVAMIGPDPAFRQERFGIEGFIESWGDWLSPFQSFRLELDEVIEGESQCVTLVRQYATPVGGTVEIENQGTAIWRFRDGQLVRVEFHLDRELGLRAAGIEPTPELMARPQSGQE